MKKAKVSQALANYISGKYEQLTVDQETYIEVPDNSSFSQSTIDKMFLYICGELEIGKINKVLEKEYANSNE